MKIVSTCNVSDLTSATAAFLAFMEKFTIRNHWHISAIGQINNATTFSFSIELKWNPLLSQHTIHTKFWQQRDCGSIKVHFVSDFLRPYNFLTSELQCHLVVVHRWANSLRTGFFWQNAKLELMILCRHPCAYNILNRVWFSSLHNMITNIQT